eukprot:758698-Rhodomonas_salina.2
MARPSRHGDVATSWAVQPKVCSQTPAYKLPRPCSSPQQRVALSDGEEEKKSARAKQDYLWSARTCVVFRR